MNKKTLIILISTVAAVLVLALVGVFVLSKYAGKDSEKKGNGSSPTASAEDNTGDTASDEQSEAGSEAQTGSTDQTGSKAQSASGTQTGKDSSSGQTVAAKDAAITVKDVSAAKGKNIKVPVVISKNPGIMAMVLQFDYDANSLEYLGCTKTALFADCEENPTTGKVKVLLAADQDVKEDGEILYLNFKVKQDAKATTQIKLTAEEGSIANYNEQLVTLVKMIDGTVTVK